MPIEIRELVIRAGVEPEPPNVPDGTPIEIPALIIRVRVSGPVYEMPEMVIQARVDAQDHPARRPGAVVMPEMVIRVNTGPPPGTTPVLMPEMVIHAAVRSSAVKITNWPLPV